MQRRLGRRALDLHLPLEAAAEGCRASTRTSPAQDAGVAGGLVNVAHHRGGALGLGALVTVLDAAGAAGEAPRELPAHRVSAALSAAVALLVVALLVTLMAHPRRAAVTPSFDDLPPTRDRTAAEADTLARTAARSPITDR